MKVYIVYSADYSHWSIEAVFTSREKAEAMAERLRDEGKEPEVGIDIWEVSE